MARALTLCMVLFGVDGAASAADTANLQAGVFSPARLAPDFTLRGSNGKDVTLSQYRGKVVTLAFGYTSCTEVCPLTLSVLARARKQLGPAGREMQVLYVTVDPERDDVDRMHAFLGAFDPEFIGGTGTGEQLAAVRKAYGIVATKHPYAGGYSIEHSSFVYLIDRSGQLRALMPFGHDADDYAHDVAILLKQLP